MDLVHAEETKRRTATCAGAVDPMLRPHLCAQHTPSSHDINPRKTKKREREKETSMRCRSASWERSKVRLEPESARWERLTIEGRTRARVDRRVRIIARSLARGPLEGPRQEGLRREWSCHTLAVCRGRWRSPVPRSLSPGDSSPRGDALAERGVLGSPRHIDRARSREYSPPSVHPAFLSSSLVLPLPPWSLSRYRTGSRSTRDSRRSRRGVRETRDAIDDVRRLGATRSRAPLLSRPSRGQSRRWEWSTGSPRDRERKARLSWRVRFSTTLPSDAFKRRAQVCELTSPHRPRSRVPPTPDVSIHLCAN